MCYNNTTQYFRMSIANMITYDVSKIVVITL